MLVLSRRENESIILTVQTPTGTARIVVSVARIVGGKVRLGVEAPPDVTIFRGELEDLNRDTGGES